MPNKEIRSLLCLIGLNPDYYKVIHEDEEDIHVRSVTSGEMLVVNKKKKSHSAATLIKGPHN